MTVTKSEPTSTRQPMTNAGNAIQAETIRKELLNFRLTEEFVLTPRALKSKMKGVI